MAKTARIHDIRMQDALTTNKHLTSHLNNTQGTFQSEIEELTKQHLSAICILQDDYITQAHSAEERKKELQKQLDREAAKFASTVEQNEQEY